CGAVFAAIRPATTMVEMDRPSRGDIPDADRAILAPARQPGAAGMEGQARDLLAVTPQCPHGAAGLRLPEPDRPIGPASRQQRPVRAEFQALAGALAGLELDDFRVGDGTEIVPLEAVELPILGVAADQRGDPGELRVGERLLAQLHGADVQAPLQ